MTELETALARITALKEKLDMTVFFGRTYSTDKMPWTVEIQVRDEVELKSRKIGATFEEALFAAWYAIENVAGRGLSSKALTPAIEHKPGAIKLVDEIPY